MGVPDYSKMSATTTVEDLKRLNHEAGKFFFSEGAMRFFKSKVYSEIWDTPAGHVFITSERRAPFTFSSGQRDPGTPRMFTVRLMTPDGGVTELSEFMEHKTKAAAIRQAERYVKASEVPADA